MVIIRISKPKHQTTQPKGFKTMTSDIIQIINKVNDFILNVYLKYVKAVNTPRELNNWLSVFSVLGLIILSNPYMIFMMKIILISYLIIRLVEFIIK